jgi:Cu(I)/Ag(I) efflux system membrane fusion protein
MKTLVTIIITAALAAAGTWFYLSGKSPAPSAAGREPLYYQSAMHPWIKSDKPGKCTICGMALTPIYPGDEAVETEGNDNVVALSDQQARALGVATAEVAVRPLQRTLAFAGTIVEDPTRHRIVSADVDGRIEKLYINFIGAEVAEGAPLADFYSPALLQAAREYRQLGGDLKRNSALRLRQMGLLPEQIENLASAPADSLVTQLLSPAAGTVVAREVYEGQYVTAGQAMFEIADFSKMWFEFLAYEQDMPWIGLGRNVTVTTPSLPGRKFMGKIDFIDPNFDAVTRATRVRVELANPMVQGRRELFNNLYADAAVETDLPAVLSVPRSAVIQTGPDAFVYLDMGGGAYKPVAVTTGRRGDRNMEISGDLHPGDRVVTNGNLLIDGQAELNRSFQTGDEEKPAAPAGELTPAQRTAAAEFLTTADAMAAALANDDLPAFTKARDQVEAKTHALAGALANLDIPKAKLEALEAAAHFHDPDTLDETRSRFLRFTMAATAALDPIRQMENFPDMQIWECPMVNEAVPGADKKGRWIQTNNRPIANPFFGSEMLQCGSRIP